jgi:hypothetical protein
MNQQAIAGILLLDEPSLEALRTSPEDLAETLGLMPVDVEALRRADRLVPKISNTQTIGTMTITGGNTTITMSTMTISAHPGEEEETDDEGNS